MRTYVRMVVCVYIPRFELVVAAGEGAKMARQTLTGRALALAPLMGSEQRVGEVSGAAEACGVERGMLLGEALARCPELVLVTPDPVLVAERWERLLGALESIGAAVEPAGPGLAYFETDGLRRLHGTGEATIAAARSALGRPARIGGAPTRFCALAAAMAMRSRRPLVLDDRQARRWLAGRPVDLLGYREETAMLVAPLRRLGVRTLGELVKLGRAPVTDRFGAAGALAYRLACMRDSRVRGRVLQERLSESMGVGDASSGEALKRVLSVLVDRRERVVFRQALSDRERIWLALSVRLLLLPAPASELGLTVELFGPPASEQGALLDQDRAARTARLRQAVAQMRAVAGQQAALRAVCVDPDSRVPERRVVLAPIPE
jgi:protein ImuB